jgi:23S rRNA pseudouridine1911/1915/1917 synthase
MRFWNWTLSSDPGSTRADMLLLEALSNGEGEWTGEAVAPSRSQIRKWIDEGRVLVDGKPVKAGLKQVRAGARFEISVPDPEPVELQPEDRPIEIIYEDPSILVVNKPPGLTVHPSETQKDGTLVHALLFHVKDLSGIGGKLRPGIVHRIDKDTSGALVITKSDEAHRALAEVFSRHEIERSYWALCYGSPKEREGHISTHIGRNPGDRKKMANVPESTAGAREARSHYRVVEEYAQPRARPFASWIEVTLETGRTHQVRVHLTGLGHSLLGDPAYGTPGERATKWLALPGAIREAVEAMPGQALHARVLGFKHPLTGEPLRFEAEPPPAFARLREALGKFK